MPRTPRESAHIETPPPGRQLLRTWLQQKIDARQDVVIVPAPGSTAPQAQATSTLAKATTPSKETTTSTSRRKPSARMAREQSLFEDPAAAAEPAGESMQDIAAEVNACTKCRLHETRDKAVPGVGPDDADLVFIGEGPGADEDRQGEPFVGRAGQLLTKILGAVELGRDEVFITNIVKCRPPNNRDPRPDEIEACEPYLKRQLRVLEPKVICTLGRHAAMTLLESKESMARLRTGERTYEGVRVFPTYHPAALLRNPQWKRPVWEDIQKVRKAYDEPR